MASDTSTTCRRRDKQKGFVFASVSAPLTMDSRWSFFVLLWMMVEGVCETPILRWLKGGKRVVLLFKWGVCLNRGNAWCLRVLGCRFSAEMEWFVMCFRQCTVSVCLWHVKLIGMFKYIRIWISLIFKIPIYDCSQLNTVQIKEQ